jgi:DNA topoisomerase IB
MRLRRADCSGPGITRVRRGRGFSYLDDQGRRIGDPTLLGRIAELVIPPAWKDVWICPYPNGHIQATGIDAAGRKQYLYHPIWRAKQDRMKFDEMIGFALVLPQMRARTESILTASEELDRERVLACALRLLDHGFFRIGSEGYAESNETYGLATMRKEHVQLRPDGLMVFDYPAKHGIQQVAGFSDPLSYEIVSTLKRRRTGGPELLAYREAAQWRDVRSPDINAFLKEVTGGTHTAKDFRTWTATAICAKALASTRPALLTKTGRKRAVVWAIKEVSRYLGNTPAVCRASYIDPRVIDAYQGGLVISDAVEKYARDLRPGLEHHHPAIHDAVLDLVQGRDASAPGLAQVA